MEFVGGDYATLAEKALGIILDTSGAIADQAPSVIIRNASWFPPMDSPADIPTISLLQDIIADGPQREMQEAVLASSHAAVFNSEFTRKHYGIVNKAYGAPEAPVIPLPVDFSLFQPGNAMGLQQELGLPDGCVLWVGASQGAAGTVKGWDIFLHVVRANPDLPFVAVFKDRAPDIVPPNLRVYERLPHTELVKVMGACRVGLCTSRTESQHLAGVEMGGCGLPMVAPKVGVYWSGGFPGTLVEKPEAPEYTQAIRAALTHNSTPEMVSGMWRERFDKPVIKAQWLKLIEEVECSGR